MDLEEFKSSLQDSVPPTFSSKNLLALWYDAKGNWDKAHDIVQITSGYDGDWIHAYLHRKEGDQSNASYWYRRVGKPKPEISLASEWEDLVVYLLEK